MRLANHRLAIAIWDGRVSPLFDVARQLLVLEVREGREQSRALSVLPGGDAGAQVERLVATQATALICGAISRPVAALVTARGIRLLPFTAGDVESVLAAYLAGALPANTLSMPGCCGRRHRGLNAGRRGRCGGGRVKGMGAR